jgi:hypothetical protein
MPPIIFGYNSSIWRYCHTPHATRHSSQFSRAILHLYLEFLKLTNGVSAPPLSRYLECFLSLSSMADPSHKPLRTYRNGKTWFQISHFCSPCITADICYNKPATNGAPYSLSREHYLRNMTFETRHNIINLHSGYTSSKVLDKFKQNLS